MTEPIKVLFFMTIMLIISIIALLAYSFIGAK